MTEGIRKRFYQVINMEAPVGPTEHNAIFSLQNLVQNNFWPVGLLPKFY